MEHLNQTLFLALNASDAPPPVLVAAAIVLAKYLFLLVPAHMALVWFGGTRTMRFIAVAGVLATAAALLASGLVGLLVPTPRPFVLGLGRALVEHRPSAAFPSNHAIVCFAWAATLAIYGRGGLAAAAAGLGLAVAWARVYLGLHFPFDMVGGALFAGASALAAAAFMAAHGARLLDGGERLASRLALPLAARLLARARRPRSANP